MNRRKGINNKWGGNRKEDQNGDRNVDNARRDKNPKRKVKFPCKFYGGYHVTYLRSCIEDSSNFIA